MYFISKNPRVNKSDDCLCFELDHYHHLDLIIKGNKIHFRYHRYGEDAKLLSLGLYP
jgi:hypothetical protein